MKLSRAPAMLRCALSLGYLNQPDCTVRENTAPAEAFAALAAGADALKLFPAELVTPQILKAIRVVLPKSARLLPVGGITPNAMQPYVEAGAGGFGLGSALYAPGMSCEQVVERAKGFVAAWQRLILA